jgi:hypothetical protein
MSAPSPAPCRHPRITPAPICEPVYAFTAKFTPDQAGKGGSYRRHRPGRVTP